MLGAAASTGQCAAQRIEQKLSFPDSGPDSAPGVIVERIDDTAGPNVDPRLKGLVIVFNAGPDATSQVVPGAFGQRYRLADVQAHGSDPVVRTAAFDPATGTFTVPGRTVAVFEQH
ncbi:MAG TPA: alpha-1,6-glucosidase domain-containing protein [Jatrophihabitans sp.]|nr:alpha-1,6-glucosidase domain-containing protein [Jatrophihabitans sp.]